MKRSNAIAIAVTERPRSLVKTADSPSGWKRATSRGCTLAGDGLPDVARSTVTTRRPSFSRHWRRKNSSRPLVSKVPATYAARALLAATGKSNTCAGEAAGLGVDGDGAAAASGARAMSATGAAVPPVFQRLK